MLRMRNEIFFFSSAWIQSTENFYEKPYIVDICKDYLRFNS